MTRGVGEDLLQVGVAGLITDDMEQRDDGVNEDQGEARSLGSAGEVPSLRGGAVVLSYFPVLDNSALIVFNAILRSKRSERFFT